jgi:hypothetical protein
VGTVGGPSCGAIEQIYANGMGVTYIPEGSGGYGAFFTAIGGVVQFAWSDGGWLAPEAAPLNARPASKMLLVVDQFAEEALFADTFEDVTKWISNMPSQLDSPRQQGTFHVLFLDEGATVRELHVPGLDISAGAGASIASAMDIDGDGEPEVAFAGAETQDANGVITYGVHLGHLVVRDDHGVPFPSTGGLSIRLASPAPGTRATASCSAAVVADELFSASGFAGPASSELLLGCPGAASLTGLTVVAPGGKLLYQAAEQSLGTRLVLK